MPRTAKIFLITLALLLTAALATVSAVLALCESRWTAMRRHVEELREGQGAPLPERLSLGRDLIPGDAWEDYFKLWIRDTELTKPGVEECLGILDGDEAWSFITSYSEWIDRVRLGARRQSARPPPMTSLGVPTGRNGDYYLVIEEATALCLASARLEAQAGNLQEAMEILTDLLLCGRDFASARLGAMYGYPPRQGLLPIQRALRALHELSAQMSPTQLRELDRRLALFDAAFPDTRGHLLDQIQYLGELLIEEDRLDRKLVDFGGTGRERHEWRYFYSSRLQATSTFRTAEALLDRALALRAGPWSSVTESGGNALYQAALDQNPLIFSIFIDNSFAIHERLTRTHLRIVRMAVHYRATGELQPIDNPEGGPLFTLQEGNTLRIWNQGLFNCNNGKAWREDHLEFRESLSVEVPVRK